MPHKDHLIELLGLADEHRRWHQLRGGCGGLQGHVEGCVVCGWQLDT